MNKQFFLILTIVFSFANIFAQTDIYNILGDKATSDQKSKIAKAKKDISRADKLFNSAHADYEKYASLLNSKKKGKRKRGEKKTLGAKKNLMSAASFYNRGYKTLFNVYYNYAISLNYEFAEDQQKADEYISQAEKKFDSGKKKLESATGFTEKDLKKKVQYKKLESSVTNGKKSMNEAIVFLVEAIKLYNEQDIKKQQLKQKEIQAWEEAKRIGTIEAYESYLANYPNGDFAFAARDSINAIEARIAEAERKTSQPNIIYRVQILADKRAWFPDEIRRKIYNSDNYYEFLYNGWYKYAIGEFHTYAEAKEFRDQVRRKVPGAFVIAFTKDGEYISDILEAIERENQNQAADTN